MAIGKHCRVYDHQVDQISLRKEMQRQRRTKTYSANNDLHLNFQFN